MGRLAKQIPLELVTWEDGQVMGHLSMSWLVGPVGRVSPLTSSLKVGVGGRQACLAGNDSGLPHSPPWSHRPGVLQLG